MENGSHFSRTAIYSKFSIVLIFVMLITLLPHYGKTLNSDITVTFKFIVHGALYLGWYIVFAIQSQLSSKGNVALHKKLGFLSIFLVCALLYSGTDLLVGVMKSYSNNWDIHHLIARTSFVLAIFHTLLSFVVFYTLGLIFRKNLQTHKRLMLLASLSMISASVTRVAFLPVVPIDGMIVTLFSTYALLLAPILIDRIRFGRIHHALKWGIPIYVVTQILFIGVLPTASFFQILAFPF